MNKSFKNSKKIELSEGWHIEPDGFNGITLVFSEPRQKENKKTGELEDYIFEDKWYHPRIVGALKEYVRLTQNSSQTIEDILEKTDKLTTFLERLDKEFRQF